MKSFKVSIIPPGSARAVPLATTVTGATSEEALCHLQRRDQRRGRAPRDYVLTEQQRAPSLPCRASLEELAAIDGRLFRAMQEAMI